MCVSVHLNAALSGNDIDFVGFENVLQMVREFARLHGAPILVAVGIMPHQ